MTKILQLHRRPMEPVQRLLWRGNSLPQGFKSLYVVNIECRWYRHYHHHHHSLVAREFACARFLVNNNMNIIVVTPIWNYKSHRNFDFYCYQIPHRWSVRSSWSFLKQWQACQTRWQHHPSCRACQGGHCEHWGVGHESFRCLAN